MLKLGEAVSKRKCIYLDTRYWIFLRDAAMDRSKDPLHELLLAHLRRAVAEGIALCPISDVMLTELLKQSDDTTRLATARVVDELSDGEALCLEDQRIGTEFAHFLYDTGARREVHPIGHLVWTKACFVWGKHYPRETLFPQETECALQKAFIDHQWGMSLEQIIRALGFTASLPAANFERTARRLNEGNRAHSHELSSFSQLVVNEISGILDLYQQRLADLMAEMYEREHGKPPNLTDAQRQDSEAQLRDVFINLFRLRLWWRERAYKAGCL